jgi:hypothetical protein
MRTAPLWACIALLSSGCIDLERLRATAGGDGGGGADGGGLVSRCPGLGVQLCDGFEGATLDPRWNMVTHSGTVSIDDAFAARGAHSLAVEALAGASGDVQAEITESETFPSTDIYMRALVYLPGTTPATAIRLMTAYQSASPFLGVSLYATPTSGGFAPRVYDGVTDTTVDTTMPGFATDRWVCLEWEVVQGNPGRVRVWVDDVEVSDLALTPNTASTPPFGVISFGLLHPAGAAPHKLWIDEVAVDRARITCDK